MNANFVPRMLMLKFSKRYFFTLNVTYHKFRKISNKLKGQCMSLKVTLCEFINIIKFQVTFLWKLIFLFLACKIIEID